MATYINNNVKFHAFSKSPVSPDTTLGGAVNPSGHTITTSQVRAQDIPAFLNTFQGTKDTAITWLGTNYATPANNDIAYYGGEFKAGFDTPKCLKYNGKTSTWEDFDLKYEDRANSVLRTTLKNADDKDVLAIHQDCSTVFVDGGNNAATNSNRWSLFVKKSDGSILDHFVASTDKIVAGMPSLGYNALVMLNNAAIDEGELDANYVGNTFAGIIHLNKQYANGDDSKFKVTCFEYIGDKLDTTLGNIREEIQDIVGVTMEGVVASVTANDAAQSAGIGVDSTSKTSPKITFTAGSVAANETKLVTGGAVKTYVDTTALAEGGSIAQKITSAINALGDVAVKSDITINDIKVKVGSGTATSLTPVNKSVTIEIPDAPEAVVTAEGTVTTDGFTKTAAVTSLANAAINAAISGTDGAIAGAIDQGISNATATVATDGSITKAGLVTAADAKTIADTAITTAVADGGTIDNRIDTLISNATSTSAIVDNDTSTKLVTAAQVATYVASEVGAVDTGIMGVSANVRPEGGNRLGSLDGITLTETADNKVKLSITTALEGKPLIAGAETWDGTWVNSYALTTGEQAQSIAKYEANKAVHAKGIDHIRYEGKPVESAIYLRPEDAVTPQYLAVAGAIYTPATDTAAGSWSVSYGLVDGDTVKASVADAVKEAKAYSDSLHTTSLDYVVLGDSESLPTASADTLGKIYLVASQNAPTADGSAISGSYVEYMTRKIGDGASATYAWEKIGTTAADLAGYAKSVTINGQTYTASAANAGALDLGTVVREVQWDNTAADHVANGSNSTYATLSSNGTLTLGIASATSDKKGISKMFTGNLSTAASTVVDTAVSVKSAQAMYSSLASLTNGKVSSVTAGNGDALTGLSVSVGGFATTPTISVTNGIINSGELPSTAKVVANGLIDGTDVIETEKINFGEGKPSGAGIFTSAATQLTTWVGDMPNLQSGYNMFASRSTLESFCGDLSSLTSGYSMFYGCTNLTSFTSDLSSLTDGTMMFYQCKLDAESLDCIVDIINDVRSLTPSGQVTKTIDIGYNCSAAAAQAAQTAIQAKGWTCTMTYNS